MRRAAGHPAAPLVLVAIAYAAAQLAVITVHMGLGWDETIYVSQVSPHVPAEYFSAPRARGVTLLAAPLVALTPSLAALRVYMTVVSSAGLVIAYWPWTRLLRPVTVALAALLFTSLWMVQFYGNEIMPNLYVAYGAVAATGWFAHVLSRSRPRAPVWLALSLTFVALMRPGDAVWITVPLAVIAVFAGRIRAISLGAMAAGLLAGVLPWIVEAYVRFGDPLRRLRESSRAEGGLGWHPEGVAMELHALNRDLLCRPCGGVALHVPVISLWWPLVPLFAAAGLVVAARQGLLRIVAVPAASGAAIGASYLLLVGYAAPRFLIPTYALLALPVAVLPAGLVAMARGRLRAVAAGAAVVGVVLLAADQQIALAHMVRVENRSRRDYAWIAGTLHRLGVSPPCTVAGEESPPLAFYSGCRSVDVSGAGTVATLMGGGLTGFAVLRHKNPRPHYARGWRRYALTTPAGRHWRVYLPPRR